MIYITSLLAMQAESSGESVSDMKAWEKIKLKKPDLSKPQPSLPDYYGNARENLVPLDVQSTAAPQRISGRTS